MSIKRWRLFRFVNRAGTGDAKMEADPDGAYVRHEDTIADPREIAPDATSICVVFWSDENGVWIARSGYHDMAGLMAHGDTPQEAISQWWIAHVAYVESLLHQE